MPLDSDLYINRPSLESLCYEAIQQLGVLLNLCAPKQMGKTSLLARILAHAKTLGYQTVSLNLQLADAGTFQELDRFLQWFCARVSKQSPWATAPTFGITYLCRPLRTAMVELATLSRFIAIFYANCQAVKPC